MILADCISKHYGRLTAVENLSLEVVPGEILGFLGPNGAGKSTTLRILSGFLPPSSGKASIDGFDLREQSLQARRRMGYLPEAFAAPGELRVGEYLRFRAGLKGLARKQRRAAVERVVQSLGLQDRIRQPFQALSKGYRQRVGLADALLHQPPALLLDEPFGGLDPIQRQEFRQFLRELAADGMAILFSSHVLPEVEDVADRILVLHQGRCLASGDQKHLQQLARAESPLQLEIRGDVERLAAALQQEPALNPSWQVLEILPEENRLRLKSQSPDPPESSGALFRWLGGQPVEVLEFRWLRPSLEDLFRRLLQGEAE
ncbi:MAG: ABC transporter ATP-binding protein [Planctomycetota bacterium]|nr:MAG: ABC transporter ATP-binding protein [Planctomycetota bacterium]